MKNNNDIKIIVNCMAFMLLITIFNNICNLYNVTTLHRIVFIFSISFSNIFIHKLLLILKKYK